MKNLAYLALAAASLNLLTSCADPLTDRLKKLGYAAAMPMPQTAHIGDLYNDKNRRSPYAYLRQDFDPAEANAITSKYVDEVVIPNEQGAKKWSVTAKADVVNYAEAELTATGAKTFVVKYTNVKQYLLSTTQYGEVLLPLIKAKNPRRNLDGKYMVTGLLQAGTLEYEFYRQNGTKIDVTPGGEIEKVFKSKFGAEWSSNNRQNISFSSPHFVGYQLSQVSDPQSAADPVPAMAPAGIPLVKTRSLVPLSRTEMLQGTPAAAR